MRSSAVGPLLLLILGLAQMAGDLLGIAPLRGIAAATAASPAPRVFSASSGLETYSSRFFVEWVGADGTGRFVELTPERYARLRGPYNRRNAYGAVVAYGPVLAANELTRPLLRDVARYAFCGDAPLLAELGIERGTDATPARVRVVPREGSEVEHLELVLVPDCAEGEEDEP